MSVLSMGADPKDAKRRSTLTAKYDRDYVRYYRIYTDDPSDGASIVLAWDELPQIGDSYVDANGNSDPNATCVRLTATEADDPQKWLIEVFYASESPDYTRENVNPLLELPVVSWGTEVIQTYVKVDLNGVPIESSAGEPYGGGIAVESRIRTVTITRNEASFDNDQADLYQETVNLNPIWGYEVGMVWLYEINTTNAHEFRGGVEYAPVAYKFKCARQIFDVVDGTTVLNRWDKPAQLDQGLMQLDINGKRQPIREGADKVTTPRALNGAGYLLARSVNDGMMTATEYLLTSATANFTDADEGANISVNGASLTSDQLDTTIVTVVSSTEALLALAASVTTPPGVIVLISRPPAWITPQLYRLADWTDLALPPTL
jgi:hypothetical protein